MQLEGKRFMIRHVNEVGGYECHARHNLIK